MPFRSQFIILFMCYFSMLTFCSFDLLVTNKIVEFTTISLLSSVSFDFFFLIYVIECMYFRIIMSLG